MDWLVNKGVNQVDEHVVSNSPNALAQVIYGDLLGVAWATKIAM